MDGAVALKNLEITIFTLQMLGIVSVLLEMIDVRFLFIGQIIIVALRITLWYVEKYEQLARSICAAVLILATSAIIAYKESAFMQAHYISCFVLILTFELLVGSGISKRKDTALMLGLIMHTVIFVVTIISTYAVASITMIIGPLLVFALLVVVFSAGQKTNE
ncbi:MAG: hypothetical protein QXL15_02075 [Candidatus Korarchaeota archaeon]